MKNQILLLFAGLFTQVAIAQGSSINVEVGADEQGNKNSALSVYLGMADEQEVEFGMGRSEVPLQSGDKTTSGYIYIGLTDKLSENWRVGGILESAGQRNAYNQLSVTVPFTYNKDSYSFGLVPVLRHLTLTTTQKKKVRITSPGFGIKGSIYPGDHFRLSGSIYNYRYSHDVSALANFYISRFFSEKTLLLSSGVLKSSANVEAGLDYDSWSISLGKNSSVSAIDNTRSNTGYLSLDFYVSDAWMVSVMGGKYESADADADTYSSLSLNYRFD